MQLHPPPRAPLDVAAAERIEAEFLAEIAGFPLHRAIAALQARMDAMLGEALAGDRLACEAGCAACCHQPLLLSFLELATIWFADEQRFSSPAFRDRLRAENKALSKWKADAGKSGATGVAQRQFAARRPCAMLGADARCTVYEARPFACRNAVAEVRCSFEALNTRGFGDLAALARRLRQRLVERYELSRFDRAPVKVATAVFYLPEGLAWFADQAPKDELRKLFAP